MELHEPYAIEASVVYYGAWGKRSIKYWYHTPFYWRAECGDEVILKTGSHNYVSHDEESFPIRFLARPVFLARQLCGKSALPAGEEVDVIGRRALLYQLDSECVMSVDVQTSFLLQLKVASGSGDEKQLNTDSFSVLDSLDPGMFGEESLITSPDQYYSGRLP